MKKKAKAMKRLTTAIKRLILLGICGISTNMFAQVIDAGADQDGCLDTVVLQAVVSNELQGSWTQTVGTSNIVSPNQYRTVVTNLSHGTNVFRWKATDGGGHDDVIVTNFGVQAQAMADTVICDNTITLRAQNPVYGTGRWRLHNNYLETVDNKLDTVTQAYNIDDRSVFVWEVRLEQCYAYDTVVVNNYTVDANLQTDWTSCDDTAALAASIPKPTNNEHGTWVLLQGWGKFDNDTLHNSVVRELNQGVNRFMWRVYNKYCYDSDTIKIQNNGTVAYAGDDIAEHCDSVLSLNANVPSNGESGHWNAVVGSVNFSDATNPSAVVSGLDYGLNQLVWSVSHTKCVSADTITIFNHMPKGVDAGTDATSCSVNYSLSAQEPSAGKGVWELAFGSGKITEPTYHHSAITELGQGVNTFRWKVTNKTCTREDYVNITNREVFSDAGTDIHVCGGSTYLLATGAASGSTGYWGLVGGKGTIRDGFDPQTSVYGLQQGKNTFTWTIDNGDCTKSDDVLVFNDAPTLAEVTANYTSCADSAKLIGNEPEYGSGKWTVIGGGGTIVTDTNSVTTVRGLLRGPSTFRWTIEKLGCPSEADLVITNNTVDAYAGDDKAICVDEIGLFGNQPLNDETGYWTLVSGKAEIVNSLSFNTKVKGLSHGTNTFLWTVKEKVPNGCSTTDLVSIHNNQPFPPTLSEDVVTCETSTDIIADAPTSGAGYWTVMQGGGQILDSTSRITRVVGLANGYNLIRWTVEFKQCSDFAEMQVQNKSIVVDAGDDQQLCDTTAILKGSGMANGTGRWTILSGSGTFSSDALSQPEVGGLSPGQNKFRWTVKTPDCPVQSDEVVVWRNYYQADAGPDRDVCDNKLSFNANQPPSGFTGTWSLKAGAVDLISHSNNNVTQVTGLQKGNNTFTWSIARQGCSTSDDLTVFSHSIITNAGDDQSLCEPKAMLYASDLEAGQTGKWTSNTNAQFVDAGKNLTYVNNLSYGKNIFTWVVQSVLDGGRLCLSTDDVAVYYYGFNVTAGGDLNLCQDSSELLATHQVGSTILDGEWSLITGSGDIDSPTSFLTNVRNLGMGANLLRWHTESNGCSAEATITITNNLVPSFAGNDQVICQANTTLHANTVEQYGAVGTWSVGSGWGTVPADQRNDPLASVSGIQIGKSEFVWTVDHKGCFAQDRVYVQNNTLEYFSGFNQEVCAFNAELEGEQPSEGGKGHWSVIAGSGTFREPTNYKTVVDDIDKGLNTYVWIVEEKGCTLDSLDEFYHVDVVNNKIVDLDAGLDHRVREDNFDVLNADGTYTGHWEIKGGRAEIEDPDNPNTVISGLQPGSNTFQWTVLTGTDGDCISSDLVEVYYCQALCPDDAFAGYNTMSCADTIQLNALPIKNVTGTWNIISGQATILEPNNAKSYITDVAPGNLVLEWYLDAKFGEVSSDTVEVFKQPFEVDAGLDTIRICKDDTISLQASAASLNQADGGFGQWSLVGEGAIDNPASNHTVFRSQGISNTTLVWTVNRFNDLCIGSDSILVINNTVAASMLLPDSAMVGEKLAWGNTSTGWEIDEVIWSVNDLVVKQSLNIAEIPYSFARSGTAMVGIMVYNSSCADSVLQSIYIKPEPEPVDTTDGGGGDGGGGVSAQAVTADWDIQVYPNPSKGDFVVRTQASSALTLKLYTAAGVWVNQAVVLPSAQGNELWFAAISPGVYFLQISNEQAVRVVPVMIEP